MNCIRFNTDDNQDVMMRYDIRSIPRIVIFKDGKEKVICVVPFTTLATKVVWLL